MRSWPPGKADFADGARAYDGGDYAAAFEAWLPLAEAGDPAAQVAVASLYRNGLGRPVDAGEAARWYRRAAEAGDSVAQLNLGDLYARGQGVERDLGQAAYWLTLSARQGRRWPQARLEEIEPLMTATERAEAARLLEAAGE